MSDGENSFEELKQGISKIKKIAGEMNSLFVNLGSVRESKEKEMISSQIYALKNSLKKTNEGISDVLKKTYMAKPLGSGEQKIPAEKTGQPIKNPETEKRKKVKRSEGKKEKKELSELEKETLKRLKKKKEKIVKEKEKKPKRYAKMANRIFSKMSLRLLDKKAFQTLERDLIKANLQFTPPTYVSIILFTTFISIFVGIIIFLFFLFFNVGATLPIVTRATEDIGLRFLKIFWILIVVPAGTFLVMYSYPGLEKKSAENRINQELPFATINMAAISGSMIDPSKIFSIIVSTKEYPYLRKEFTKLINEINIHGYNFVSALRKGAFNSPSKKLAELYGGLATTINSGGDLPKFFDERAKTLLFEHKLEREKYTKSAETFMDIYISVVIAAPMILMLLLMMMRISGLGLSLSTSTITLMMVIGVSVINIVFLSFLQLKKTE